MNYQVKLTGLVKRDMRHVAEYIANELKNPNAANRLIDDAEEHILSLSESSFLYPLVRDDYLAGNGVRHFPVRNYLVFYVVSEASKSVVVLRFLYGRRDWINILKNNTAHTE
ncbi:translation repressor RelE [Synergistales bacterium]|nr:translation repressor RelE [Synergistales bacterium]